MQDESIFKLIVMVGLGFAIVIAVLIFSGILPGFSSRGGDGTGGTVTMWGVVPSIIMNEVVANFNDTYKDQFVLQYVAKNPNTITDELVETLAVGGAPDLILAPHDITVSERNKFYIIPYDSIDARTFSDTFAEIGELYNTSTGVSALPMTVDPLVMYYNRDLYSNNGVASVPKTWTTFLSIHQRLNKRDSQNVITESGLAFGEASNVLNFKSILEMLFLQAGNPIVSKTESAFYRSVLSERLGFNTAPGAAALDFFTAFSNPNKVTYSWNETLNQDREMFIAGKLANYFGYASELSQIRTKNPNLNLDVVVVPQRDETARKTTSGQMLGVSIVKNTDNLPTAFIVAWNLATGPEAKVIADSMSVTPARRDLLSVPNSDNRFEAVFYESALYARTWADPNKIETTTIFSEMVNNVNRGLDDAMGALGVADQKINLLFSNL